MGRPLLLALFVASLVTGCQGDPPKPHLSEAAQSRLPQLSLGNLCPGAETPPELDRQLRREAEALLEELREHPDWRVRHTFYTEEEGPIEESITVRELGEIALIDLRSGIDEGSCDAELERRFEDALD